jgi:hypothetical protein
MHKIGVQKFPVGPLIQILKVIYISERITIYATLEDITHFTKQG